MPKPPPPRRPRTAAKPTKKAGPRQTYKKKIVKKTPLGERKLLELTGRQRTFLRGLSHDLNAVMQLGKASTKKALLEELDRTLDAHELIKVRVLRECPDDIDTLIAVIEKQLKANVVGKLGRILVLYRRNPENCRIALPVVKKKATQTSPVELPFDDDEDDDTEFESETSEE